MSRSRSRYWIFSYSTANLTSSDDTDSHHSPRRVRQRQLDMLGGYGT
jgi:hypothetical protein